MLRKTKLLKLRKVGKIMKTKELIELLKELDPNGELKVEVSECCCNGNGITGVEVYEDHILIY